MEIRQIKHWNQFNENIFLNVIKKNTNEEIPLYFTKLLEDNSISLLAPLGPDNEWKKFGYKYFNPEDRAFFASIFKQSYLATDINKTFECLAQVF